MILRAQRLYNKALTTRIAAEVISPFIHHFCAMLPLLLVAKLVFSSRLATLTRNIDTGFLLGHDKMRSGADLRITSPFSQF